MRFVTEVTLHAQSSVEYTTEVIEELIDAFFELDYVDEVDADGSLASRDLHVRLIVAAADLDTALSQATRAVQDALTVVGGAVVGPDGPSSSFRKTSVSTRELEPA